ncbi:hypothetical protein PW5551_07705 [Petrotoga sp. 9PW.55.5.1]|uniref:GNAT family N-acetyltransferase n=1 Tax=Petrotoga sp. 9PW.55.5.1 TaxID=1308979 RepID=UPI000DC566B0|nr:GNAT family N-acetyltransferase [Petrotoga sp. 9PW.55.5.1]RAO98797.1 hypothetical protein PW5551_07705 [Petrotoga sp. 9PW.55.5.1]
MFVYKPLKEVSISVVIELVNEVFKDYVIPVNWNLETFEKDVKENSISLEDSFVVFSDKEPVGFSIISLRKDIGRIDSIGVKKEYRGEGLASEVMYRTIETLKWKDITRIILEVAESDERSIKYYKKHGFRIIRKLNSFVVEKKENRRNQFEYESTKSDVVYELATQAKFELGRNPNWQREPITIKLSENRYNYETIKINGKLIGYVVWGFNKDNAYIVDAAPLDKYCSYDELIKDITSKLLEIKERIILVSVPEDDPLNKALLNNGYSVFIKQNEMERKLH